jgi:predicted nuclease of predicted toxin-antitoxin system
MLFLVDEDLGIHIAAALRELGHEVHLSTSVLGTEATDADVADHAETISAIVVTQNKKDFFRMLQRRQEAPRRFRKAGCIAVVCGSHVRAVERIRLFQRLWELEHELALSNGADPRAVIEIYKEKFIVHR